MAKRSSTKHASARPSAAEKGAQFGFPAGSTVEITEIKCGTWEEAGEQALKGDRNADDPALIITGEVEDSDGEPITVFLSNGKANRLQPSDDGEFFDPAEGSSATGWTEGSNANVFVNSLTDKKRQGKSALDEEVLDDGVSALVGLKFVAGYEIVKREGLQGGDRKTRPSLIAEEIVEAPSGGGGGSSKKSSKTSSKASSRSKREEPEEEGEDEEQEEKPKRRASSKREEPEDEDDDEAQTEKIILEIMENPKYKKGLPVSKVFNSVFNIAKTEDNKKKIMALVEDEEWLVDDDRPWQVKGKGEDQVLLPA